jgi:hypothetical protein
MKLLSGLKRYAFRVLIGVDQLFNAVLNGEPDETFSSRSGRSRDLGQPLGKVVCVVLDSVDADHCTVSIEGPDDPHHMGKTITEIARVPLIVKEPLRGDPATCEHVFKEPWMNCTKCGVEKP